MCRAFQPDCAGNNHNAVRSNTLRGIGFLGNCVLNNNPSGKAANCAADNNTGCEIPKCAVRNNARRKNSHCQNYAVDNNPARGASGKNCAVDNNLRKTQQGDFFGTVLGITIRIAKNLQNGKCATDNNPCRKKCR